MVTSEELGKRIREAREGLGMSQQQLGQLLNPPRSHAAVSDMERGVTRVGATDIAQLARIFNRGTSFFYGEEASTPQPSGLQGRGNLSDDVTQRFRQHVDEQLKQKREEGEGE